MASLFGRKVVAYKLNNSGGGVIAGDVVVPDTTADNAFTTTTSAAVTTGAWVADETIASGATGRVVVDGHVTLINVTASVTRGHTGTTSTTVKKAVSTGGTTRTVGTFCKFTTGGTTPEADIWPVDLGSGSGELVSTSAIWTAAGQIVKATGSAAASVLNIGTAAQLLRVNSGATAPEWFSYDALTEATLAGDVTMTTAGTYYDGPTLTPAAGTYEVFGRLCLVGSGTNSIFTGRIIANGSATPIDETESGSVVNTHDTTICLAARVVADGSNPILLRATNANNGGAIKRDPVVSSSGIHRASLLRIQRVA